MVFQRKTAKVYVHRQQRTVGFFVAESEAAMKMDKVNEVN
jgi:hypothetical protein